MRSKKAAYNIISNLILQIIVLAYGFIVPKIIIVSFGSNVNGLISSITQFLAYIALLESGFGPVVKSALYKPIAKKNKQEICNILKTTEHFFKTISILFLIYIIVLCIIYPLLVDGNLGRIYTISLIIIISISTFAEYFFGMTYRLFLQAEQKSYIIFIIQIITYIISILLIIILAKMGTSIQIIKLVSGIVFVFRPILQNFYVKKRYNINLKEASKEYKLSQKWDGLAQHIAAVIHNNTDITILTIFTKLTEVSVYSVYYLVIKGVKSLMQSFTGSIDATFGDMIAKNETENLRKKFTTYEILYNIVCTILFSCTMVLIVPFISIYTKGITDADYIRYAFGTLLVISEYIWALRLPYSSITLAAGHFKETRVGAWVECILNILISIVLVQLFGIIGVTIGTIIAMSLRTIEFIYHTNKYILNRNIFESIKKLLLVILETLVIIFVSKYLPYLEYSNYINLLLNSIIIGVVATGLTLTLNFVFFKKDIINCIYILKNIFRK